MHRIAASRIRMELAAFRTMPALTYEPDCYPLDLFGEGMGRVRAGRRWWALHTRPRQEKAVARDLHSIAIPHFLPQHRQSVIRSGRRRHAWLPLFPGYLFLLANDQERLQSLATNRLASVLAVMLQDELESDLCQLHRVIESRLAINYEPCLVPGQRVRVVGGALSGLEGIVVRRGGPDRLVVSVRFLGQGVSLELANDDLESLETPHLAGHPREPRISR